MSEPVKIWCLFRKSGLLPRTIRAWWVVKPDALKVHNMIPHSEGISSALDIVSGAKVLIEHFSHQTGKTHLAKWWIEEVEEDTLIKVTEI